MQRSDGLGFRALALLLATGTLAAACTSGADDATTTTTSPAATVDPTGAEVGVEPSSDPGRSGTLIYAVEHGTQQPWAHFEASCRLACRLVLEAVADPLVLPSPDGGVVPVLLDAIEASDDFGVWTLAVRDGIEFHDGTPLDAEAVAFNLQTCRAAPLTGPDLVEISTVEVVDGDVVVTMSNPWSSFPMLLAGSACTFVLSPTWLASLASVPQRDPANPWFDPAMAATPADGTSAAPVGSGPFVFDRYDPGAGNTFRAIRNEEYWRGPAGVTGEELPRLDAVELVFDPSSESRVVGVADGTYSIAHVDQGEPIATATADATLTVVQSLVGADTDHVVFNVAAGLNASAAAVLGVEGSVEMDPDGSQVDNPLVHLSCRKALVAATDHGRLVTERHGGALPAANGPFPPGVAGHLDVAAPTVVDSAQAQVELERCLVEAETERLRFTLLVPAGGPSAETGELLASMWVQQFGAAIDVAVEPVPAEDYLQRGIDGSFQAMILRLPGAIDLDAHHRSWSIRTASPIGQFALNTGRFLDPVIDQSLAIQRRTTDAALRRGAAEEINRSFAANAWNLWLTWRPWVVVHRGAVRDVTVSTSPEGVVTVAIDGGQHRLAHVWCVEGVCR